MARTADDDVVCQTYLAEGGGYWYWLRPWHCTALVENETIIIILYYVCLFIHCTEFSTCIILIIWNQRYWKRKEFFIKAMLVTILIASTLFIIDYILLLISFSDKLTE